MSNKRKKTSCLLIVLLVFGAFYVGKPFIFRFLSTGYWGTDHQVNQRHSQKMLRRDEKVLRHDFNIPKDATLVFIESIPRRDLRYLKKFLRISATFSFKSADFDAYLAQAKKDNQWQPLPPPDNFLIKILGIRSAIEKTKFDREYNEQPLPEPGSRYNPTSEQLLARRKKNLPLDVSHGLYRCLTARRYIMLIYTSKVSCSEKSGDLNNYMFGVLDLNEKMLHIKIRT